VQGIKHIWEDGVGVEANGNGLLYCDDGEKLGMDEGDGIVLTRLGPFSFWEEAG